MELREEVCLCALHGTVQCVVCAHVLATKQVLTRGLLYLSGACRQIAAVRTLGEQDFIQCVAFDPAGSFVGRYCACRQLCCRAFHLRRLNFEVAVCIANSDHVGLGSRRATYKFPNAIQCAVDVRAYRLLKLTLVE